MIAKLQRGDLALPPHPPPSLPPRCRAPGFVTVEMEHSGENVSDPLAERGEQRGCPSQQSLMAGGRGLGGGRRLQPPPPPLRYRLVLHCCCSRSPPLPSHTMPCRDSVSGTPPPPRSRCVPCPRLAHRESVAGRCRRAHVLARPAGMCRLRFPNRFRCYAGACY